MEHIIYAERAGEVIKTLDKLAEKSRRYGVPFLYTVSEEFPHTVTTWAVDDFTNTRYKTGSYTVPAVRVNVECDGLIRANGWHLLAKIEHGDMGNVVTCIVEQKMDTAWFNAPARCDHCGTNRRRAVTYIVERDNGDRRQVGRGCLHEYTGIDPNTAALWATVRDLLWDDRWESCGEEEFQRRYVPMLEVERVLAFACESVKAFGYRKSDEIKSTRDDVVKRLQSKRKPDAQCAKEAETVAQWLRGKYGTDGLSNLMQNCVNLAASGWAKIQHVGMLAYMPVAYQREQERMAREEKRREAADRSRYVGSVGERLSFKADTAALITSWDGLYGTTFLYKFTDGAGNVYIWYASKCVDVRDGAKVTGTVKDHKDRDGVQQTVITRCKVA